MIPLSMLCLSIAWSPKLHKLQVHSEVSSVEYKRLGSVKVKTARSTITLITSLLKTIFIIVFAFGFNFFVNLADDRNPGFSVRNGFMYFADDNRKFVTFLVQV